MDWIVKVETDIEDEEARKLLTWAIRKVGMKVLSIDRDTEWGVWLTPSLTTSITGEHE